MPRTYSLTIPMQRYTKIDCTEDCDSCLLICAWECTRFPNAVCEGCPCLKAEEQIGERRKNG